MNKLVPSSKFQNKNSFKTKDNVLPTRYVYHWNSVEYDELIYKLSLKELDYIVHDNVNDINKLW